MNGKCGGEKMNELCKECESMDSVVFRSESMDEICCCDLESQ